MAKSSTFASKVTSKWRFPTRATQFKIEFEENRAFWVCRALKSEKFNWKWISAQALTLNVSFLVRFGHGIPLTFDQEEGEAFHIYDPVIKIENVTHTLSDLDLGFKIIYISKSVKLQNRTLISAIPLPGQKWGYSFSIQECCVLFLRLFIGLQSCEKEATTPLVFRSSYCLNFYL